MKSLHKHSLSKSSTFMGIVVILAAITTSCSESQEGSILAADSGSTTWAKGSVINTTDNTWNDNGDWQSTMGPLNKNKYGIACDGAGSYDYRSSNQLWFVAPSDSFPKFGIKTCGANPNGGEPSCSENYSFCGRKVRVSCKSGNPWCGIPGQQSILAKIKAGSPPTNNIIPQYYIDQTANQLGSSPNVPKSVVLTIVDFCPAGHSANKASGACQGPQLDMSAAAFLLLGKENAQSYIDTNLDVNVELLTAGDSTVPGPQY